MPEFDATVEYRDVVGFPGYKVSNIGTVWSCKSGQWKQLKPAKHPFGHLNVSPSRNNVSITKWVHHLVLEAFVGQRPSGTECCHYDGDPSNNNLVNLRWDTPLANGADRVRHGRVKSPGAKLTVEIVLQIRAERAAGEGCTAIARKYKINVSTAWEITTRRTWKHI